MHLAERREGSCVACCRLHRERRMLYLTFLLLLGSGLLSLSVKGAEVASMTMNVIQTVPNLDWLSVWIKAYAFVHTGDNSRAINTIW